MKKFFSINLLLFITIFLLGCEDSDKFVEYQIGDIVTKDGIIYEYADFTIERGNIYSFNSNDDDEDVLYHDYYYYDMLNPLQDEITPYIENNEHTYLAYGEMALKTMDSYYYLGVKYFKTSYLKRFPSWDIFSVITKEVGFIVKGYTDKIKDNVVIPEYINQNETIAVGYKALKNAPIKSIEFQSTTLFVFPYGLDGLSNLEKITLPKLSFLLSMAIANCPSLEEVVNLVHLNDASLYNLPSLTKVHYSDIVELSDSFDPEISAYYSVKPSTLFGLYRSSFYLCPSIQQITTDDRVFAIIEDENTFYYSWLGRKTIFYVKDDFHININEVMNRTWMVNAEGNYLYVPFLNDGLNRSGTFSYEESQDIKIVDNQVYYRPAVLNNNAAEILTRTKFFIFKTCYS